MRRFAIFVVACAGFLLASEAGAGRLVTPPLFSGGANHQNVCVAINVGNQPIEVTVEIIGLLADESDTCTVLPNDLDSSCQVAIEDFAFCRVITDFGQPRTTRVVRVVLMNRLTIAPFTIETAVEAR